MRELDASRFGHLLDARYWLQGAKENASGNAVGQAGNIQAVVIAIDEIHVGVTGRAEENGIPCRPARRGVGRRIALAEISFGFDDSAGENSARRFPEQQFPEQRPRYLPRVAIEELGFE